MVTSGIQQPFSSMHAEQSSDNMVKRGNHSKCIGNEEMSVSMAGYSEDSQSFSRVPKSDLTCEN